MLLYYRLPISATLQYTLQHMKRPHPRAFLRRQYLVKSKLIKFPHHKGKKRVSIITGQLAAGGVERVLLNIILGLPRDSFEVTVYITDFNNNVWIDRFKEYCTVVPISRHLNWTTDEKTITEYLAASILLNKDDVILITNSTVGYKSLPKICHKNKNIRAYDLLHTYGTPAEDDAFLKISYPYDQYLDSRVVISNYLKKYLHSKYSIPNNRILTIRNGIPLGQQEEPYSRSQGKKIIKAKDKKAITYMGRLQADKSPERLVELADHLQDMLRDHDAFIAIFGEGELRNQLEEDSRKRNILNDTIRFYGQTNDPLSVMSASYFTILTSNLEGVPMSVLESMNVGTPTIAPAVGGLPEIIQEGSGILVEFDQCRTEEEKMLHLEEGVIRALNLQPKDLSLIRKNAKLVIKKNFSHMEKDYIQLFAYGTEEK